MDAVGDAARRLASTRRPAEEANGNFTMTLCKNDELARQIPSGRPVPDAPALVRPHATNPCISAQAIRACWITRSVRPAAKWSHPDHLSLGRTDRRDSTSVFCELPGPQPGFFLFRDQVTATQGMAQRIGRRPSVQRPFRKKPGPAGLSCTYTRPCVMRSGAHPWTGTGNESGSAGTWRASLKAGSGRPTIRTYAYGSLNSPPAPLST